MLFHLTDVRPGGIFLDKGANYGPQARASLLRQLPQVDDLLRHPELAPAIAPLPRSLAAAVVRRVLAATRRRINAEPPAALPPSLDEPALLQDLREALLAAAKPRLRRVVNATGVVIHTNLGRSPLGEAALEQIREVAAHYCTLEYDLARGPGAPARTIWRGCCRN